MKLEYQTRERWPAGLRLADDETTCTLNVGMLPAWCVFTFVGLLWGIAALYAGTGGYQVWRGWQAGFGVDAKFAIAVLASAGFFAACGALLLRWQVRSGHLPALYRLDRVRGVLALRGERSGRWHDTEMGRVVRATVRELRLPGGRVVGLHLHIRIEGVWLGANALFTPGEREAIERFVKRVNDCVAVYASNVR